MQFPSIRFWDREHRVVCDISARRALGLALAVSVLCIGLRSIPLGESLEAFLSHELEFKTRHWLKRDPAIDPRIRIYAIGDSSISELSEEGLDLADWSKSLMSLDSARPRSVIIDKVFSAPRGIQTSTSFLKSLKGLHFPVTAASFVSKHPISSRTPLPLKTFNIAQMDELEWLSEEAGYAYGPSAQIRDGFTHIGHVMYSGNLRMKPVLRLNRHEYLPSAALSVAENFVFKDGKLMVDGKSIPVDRRGRTLINLSHPTAYYDRLFKMSGLVARGREGIKTDLPQDAVVVLLPSMYTGATDMQPSPFGTVPGGFFIVAMINSVLTGQWIHSPPHGWVMVLLSGLLACLILRIGFGPYFFFSLVGLSIAIPVLGLSSFSFLSIQIPWLSSLTALCSTSLLLFIENARIAQRKLLHSGEVEKDLSRILDTLGTKLAPADGVRLGRYHIVEFVGRGGMGEVYRANSYGAGEFTKEFAIKRIVFSERRNERALRQFEAEARLNSILTHSNIAQVFEFFRMRDTYLMVMEFIHGHSLSQIIETLNGPIPVPVAVFIIDEVCKGLEYAHDKKDQKTGNPLNIVHRDISPQNIMISNEGAVKLIDFGIAKGQYRREVTPTGAAVTGKFAYMSPEQASGKPVDHRSDLFSAALVFYELLTGVKVMAGESEIETIGNVIRCAIPKAIVLNPKLPRQLDRILNNCLAKDPDDRYQSVSAFRMDLHPFLKNTVNFSHTQTLATLIKEVFTKTPGEVERKSLQDVMIDRSSTTRRLSTKRKKSA